MASIGAIFTLQYHTKHLNPWQISSASHVVNHSRLSVVKGRWGQLKATLALMNVRQALERALSKSGQFINFLAVLHICAVGPLM